MASMRPFCAGCICTPAPPACAAQPSVPAPSAGCVLQSGCCGCARMWALTAGAWTLSRWALVGQTGISAAASPGGLRSQLNGPRSTLPSNMHVCHQTVRSARLLTPCHTPAWLPGLQGFHGSHVKDYMEASVPQFAVGEWPLCLLRLTGCTGKGRGSSCSSANCDECVCTRACLLVCMPLPSQPHPAAPPPLLPSCAPTLALTLAPTHPPTPTRRVLGHASL